MKGFDEYYDEAVTGLHRRNKAGFKRRGARKNGEWYFDALATSAPGEA